MVFSVLPVIAIVLIVRSICVERFLSDLASDVHDLNIRDIQRRRSDNVDLRDAEYILMLGRWNQMIMFFWRRPKSFMSDRLKALMRSETFELVEDPEGYKLKGVVFTGAGAAVGILCHLCKMTSWSPNDVIHRYCGYCDHFHETGREAALRD